MTFKPCKYGCSVLVEVRQMPEGWRPFEESGTKHDCPKSPYNMKKKGLQQQPQEPTEEEYRKMGFEEQDDHGNDAQTLAFATGSHDKQEIKQKGLQIKILRSRNPQELESMHKDFGTNHIIRFAQYEAVNKTDDQTEYSLCVSYEAEV